MRRLSTAFLVVATLVALSLLALSAAQQTDALAQGDLSRYWRPAYDILVRPVGSRRSIEVRHGLVAPNFALNQAGGISPAQLAAIRRVPEVEVAAPIAPLGYVPLLATGNLFYRFKVTQAQAYRVRVHLLLDDGIRQYTLERSIPYLFLPDPAPVKLLMVVAGDPEGVFSDEVEVPIFVAGVDPQAEAQLVGLKQAIVLGDYLSREAVHPVPFERAGRHGCLAADVLFHRQGFARLQESAVAEKLRLPPDFRLEDWWNASKAAWISFLIELPAEKVVARAQADGETLYHSLFVPLERPELFTNPNFQFLLGEIRPTVDLPAPLDYEEVASSGQDNSIHLRLRPVRKGGVVWGGYESEVLQYRSMMERRLDKCSFLKPVGVYDIGRLPQQDKANKVPMELYSPPDVLLVTDAQGQPVNPPKPLYPTLNPAGYLQPPPLALTTVDAVCTVLGREDCISAVRVRVAGIEAMSPAAQAKIEAVAGEIHRRTGLEVDIMVGSSPTPVLVDVPDVGTVQEFWIRKGVTTAYQERINLGQWLFLALLAVVAGLYTVHQGWLMLAREQQALALRKALGWRTGWVVRQTVGSYLLAVAAGAAMGALAAWGAALAAGHAPLPWWAYAVVPVGMLAAFGLGATPAALSVVRMAPVAVLRMGGLRGERERKGRGGVGSLWGYTLTGWRRRPRRALAVLLANALAGGLVVLLAAILVDRQAYLRTTLLGQYILLHLGPEHGLMVGLTLLLAGLLTGNDLSAEVASRRGEFGLLRALGWREGAVRGVVLREGWLSGVLGGLLGGLLGWGAFWAMYAASPRGLGWLLAAGVALPGLVGVLAAWLPARRAARIPPAQVLRGE